MCHFRDGEDCLGLLKPGTYHTTAFTPPLTYTVPRGWTNVGDASGDFMLTPGGSGPRKVDSDTGDSVGVFTSVRMDRECSYRHPAAIPPTPAAYTRWLRRQPDLVVRRERPVTLGGLNGTVQTLTISNRAHATCPWDTYPSVPYLAGKRPTTLENNVTYHDVIRLYLLSTTYFGERVVLAVEVISVRHGRGLGRLIRVAQSLRFGHPL